MKKDDIILLIEQSINVAVKREFENLQKDILAALGISEFITRKRAVPFYTETFIRKWLQENKLKNYGTERKMKFKISEIEQISLEDVAFQLYREKKKRIRSQ